MRTNGKKPVKRGETHPRPSARSHRRVRVPIWQEILGIAKAIPEGDLHKLPTDLAANHDHYLYGSRQA